MSFTFKVKMTFMSQGTFPLCDSMYLYAFQKLLLLQYIILLLLRGYINEGEFPTCPPSPGKKLEVGRELHYKILGLRKGPLFPGIFAGAFKSESI